MDSKKVRGALRFIESYAESASKEAESGNVLRTRQHLEGIIREAEHALEHAQQPWRESLPQHFHVNAQDGTDACKDCGLDLRNPVHIRGDIRG